MSATALVAFTYWNTERSLNAQTDQIIEAEITGLAEQYQRLGLGPGRRGRQPLDPRRPGALSAGGRRALRSPAISTNGRRRSRTDGFHRVRISTAASASQLERRARGRAFVLVGGFELLVARDVDERD